jgi:hypothetical protein
VNTIKVIPYGDANFESVKNQKAVYIDKTQFKPLVEKP